jgi:signal transduction histidine kinase
MRSKSARFFFLLVVFIAFFSTRLWSQARVVRVGFPEIPGIFEYHKNGERTGYFVDLQEIIAQKQGWTLEYIDASWEACLTMLHSGEIDLLGFVGRESFGDWLFDYNRENIISVWSSLLLQAHVDFNGIESLQARQIALLSGRSETAEFLQFTYATNLTTIPIYFDAVEKQIESFISGTSEAILLPSHLIVHLKKLGTYKDTGIVFSPRAYCFAVKKDANQDLINGIDLSINAIKLENPVFFQTLHKKFLAPPREYRIPQWFFALLFSLTLAAITSIIFVTLLRIQVTKNTKTLKQQRDDLQKLSFQKDQVNMELESFSYSVSHDLRAPLRAIDGFSTILLSEHGDSLNNEGKHLLSRIASNTKQMNQLITKLLDFSRVGKLAIQYVAVDMNALIAAILNEIETPEIRETFTVNVNPLPDAWCDTSLMWLVWHNLISNSFKYSMKSTLREINISASVEDNELRYEITDKGAGFDPVYKHKLFNIFQRLHGENEFAGTGVGLAIVQRIIHRHEGRVGADSEIGKGATFFFTLPRVAHKEIEDRQGQPGHSVAE